MDTTYIRNFCILAHIDHGKSTLADRFLEMTGTVEKRKMRAQFLDQMDLERERGITIKMQPVRMRYTDKGIDYILNLIDTPGHVDFSYEVSRALAAVEGALLLVDISQGIQAQTIANLHLAQKEHVVVIPVLNKIDLSSADREKREMELMSLLGVAHRDIFSISAKEGTGVSELLEGIIRTIPPPLKREKEIHHRSMPSRALIFDSMFDPYQGIVAHIRMVEGTLNIHEKLFFMQSHARAEAMDVGIFSPARLSTGVLEEGEIGYVATGIKEAEKVRVGDTIASAASFHTLDAFSNSTPLPGYQDPRPMVFATIFPENQDEYESLRDALYKLKLNDAALTFEPEQSGTLGRGFRSGFLGMLHMEIVAERLRREYGLKLIFSNPSVAFMVAIKDGGEEIVYSAAKMPDTHARQSVKEPWVSVEIIAPERFLGILTTLIHARGGVMVGTATLSGGRLRVQCEAPLREIVVDFYDVLKSATEGFGSMAYEWLEWRPADLVRMDILVASSKIPAFSEVVPRDKVFFIARERVEKLKNLIPKELFQIALQAEVEGRIIARETIPAMRKDVTGYLYGGDRTRKMKLWKKQQKGKKRLQNAAHVEIPPEVFLKMLKK